MKKIGITNLILIGILFLLSIFFIIGGLPRVIVWLGILFVMPFLGIIFIVISFIIKIFMRKSQLKAKTITFYSLCIIYIFPILFTMNIIPVTYPANIDSVKPSITVDWPLKEETVVAWGGDTREKNFSHAIIGSERWAYDMVMEPFNTGDSDLASYGIWDKEVVSPVNGIVVAVYDDDRDIPPNQNDFESMEGNYVYIEIEETGTYLLLNHLKKDSVVVSAGDRVNIGDLLGHIGNSGTSSEPHLHIHHQRQNPTKTIHPLFAEGLPLYFNNSQGISMPKGNTVISP